MDLFLLKNIKNWLLMHADVASDVAGALLVAKWQRVHVPCGTRLCT